MKGSAWPCVCDESNKPGRPACRSRLVLLTGLLPVHGLCPVCDVPSSPALGNTVPLPKSLGSGRHQLATCFLLSESPRKGKLGCAVACIPSWPLLGVGNFLEGGGCGVPGATVGSWEGPCLRLSAAQGSSAVREEGQASLVRCGTCCSQARLLDRLPRGGQA